MKKIFIITLLCFITGKLLSQAGNEIQVYNSKTTDKNSIIFELHHNYTFNGSKYLLNPKDARVANFSLETTYGISPNAELGFYVFTRLQPNGKYQYLGSHIRPRITAPEKWNLKTGLSLSLELGFFRNDVSEKYIFEGELRPIIDRTFGKYYFSLNPNVDFSVVNSQSEFNFVPQFKFVYTLNKKYGFGFEYYSDFGKIGNFYSWKQQEHLIGPVFNLYTNPKYELEAGFLFGLNKASNQQIFKLLIGRRYSFNKNKSN